MQTKDYCHDTIRADEWQDGVLKLIDQRLLPAQRELLSYRHAADVALAI